MWRPAEPLEADDQRAADAVAGGARGVLCPLGWAERAASFAQQRRPACVSSTVR
jgi:hypothetical protein